MAAQPVVQEPQLLEMPHQRMAVVRTEGAPDLVAGPALKALYGAVYGLKFALKKRGIDLKVGAPRARWPNANRAPRDRWIAFWALPVPEDTQELPTKQPSPAVTLETWHYGLVAQVLHLGPYAAEGPNVQRLHQFIADAGCEITGYHEEEYLSSPRAKMPKTLIRYQVRHK